VKIRSGLKEDETNAKEVIEVLQAAGAAAVTLHPRSQQQRYSKREYLLLCSSIDLDILPSHKQRLLLCGNYTPSCGVIAAYSLQKACCMSTWHFLAHCTII
jgi:Dihydrouridine synthase (Dus)